MGIFDKVRAFFKKPAAGAEVAKPIVKVATVRNDDEMNALLDWVENDKPQTISGVNAQAIWFDEVTVETPNYNRQLCIRKYKTQKKNWAHWKKRGRK